MDKKKGKLKKIILLTMVLILGVIMGYNLSSWLGFTNVVILIYSIVLYYFLIRINSVEDELDKIKNKKDIKK